MTKIAINGFGRIGRLLLRSAAEYPNLDFVGINDLTDIETMAHLFKYDSTHGTFQGAIEHDSANLTVNGDQIAVLSEPDPARLPWAEMGVDVVVESTGRFRNREDVMKHLQAGARKVIISAPAKDPDWTVVMGVNHLDYDSSRHNIISNASCTTNCLAPAIKVLLDAFGIEKATMTTIHSYTNDQHLLDLPHKDLRRARAAALSMVPTSTGAAKAVSLVLPGLQDKLSGMAIRVPTPNVSLVDLVVQLSRETTADEINTAFKDASATRMQGILGYSDEPLVSRDYNGDTRSGIVDGLSTLVDGNLAKILIWYDNEWGYSCRILDLIQFMYR
ncbi:type I glyceraldehyde-3-phosphate dehydrogenase [bacterium]|nr:type I glyceraldehyde-3-phosphate dehydrogenase [candidate division CSSED10-310 bacterium]